MLLVKVAILAESLANAQTTPPITTTMLPIASGIDQSIASVVLCTISLRGSLCIGELLLVELHEFGLHLASLSLAR